MNLSTASVSVQNLDHLLRLSGIEGAAASRFRNLAGKVLYFRPKVWRKSAKGFNCERVLFVQNNGQAHLTTTDGSPKRSFMVQDVAAVFSGEGIVVLTFNNCAEHDLFLQFRPLKDAVTASTHFSQSSGDEDLAYSTAPLRVPTDKQFLQLVQHFNPSAEVAKDMSQENLLNLELELGKPKGFHHPLRLPVLLPETQEFVDSKVESRKTHSSGKNSSRMSDQGVEDGGFSGEERLPDEEMSPMDSNAVERQFADLYSTQQFVELENLLQTVPGETAAAKEPDSEVRVEFATENPEDSAPQPPIAQPLPDYGPPLDIDAPFVDVQQTGESEDDEMLGPAHAMEPSKGESSKVGQVLAELDKLIADRRQRLQMLTKRVQGAAPSPRNRTCQDPSELESQWGNQSMHMHTHMFEDGALRYPVMRSTVGYNRVVNLALLVDLICRRTQQQLKK